MIAIRWQRGLMQVMDRDEARVQRQTCSGDGEDPITVLIEAEEAVRTGTATVEQREIYASTRKTRRKMRRTATQVCDTIAVRCQTVQGAIKAPIDHGNDLKRLVAWSRSRVERRGLRRRHRSIGVVPARTGTRTRGAGRPAARRTTSNAASGGGGPSGDSDEGPGEPPEVGRSDRGNAHRPLGQSQVVPAHRQVFSCEGVRR